MKEKLFDLKVNLSIVTSLFFLMILGCQPSGGELLPLAGDDIVITTSRFENDTAVVIQNDITVKFYGNWNGEHNLNLRIVVFNASDKAIKIIFDEFIAESVAQQDKPLDVAIKKHDGSVLISTDTIYENYDSNNQKKIPSVEIKSGDKKSFMVGFMRRFGGGEDENSPKGLVKFSLPVQKGKESLFYFKAGFRGIFEESGHFSPDPKDW